MRRLQYIYVLLLCFASTVFAQDKMLSKEEAVALALKNNFGVIVANNNLKIAENNKSILNLSLIHI